MAYFHKPFAGFMSLQEAAEIWEKDASTLRKAIARGDLVEGKDVAKFGKQWVITAKAMAGYTGRWGPWNIYVEQRTQ